MSDEIKTPEAQPADVDLTKTRTAIMMKLAIATDKVMLEEGFDFSDNDIRRRFFRAMVHLAVKKMLDVGAPPQFLMDQMLEALGHELQERAELQQIEGNVPCDTHMN